MVEETAGVQREEEGTVEEEKAEVKVEGHEEVEDTEEVGWEAEGTGEETTEVVVMEAAVKGVGKVEVESEVAMGGS